MAEKPPSFQFYPRDFMSDPAVISLSLAELGAYMRILCLSWLSDDPGVVAVADLPRLSGFKGLWPRHEAAIGRCFDRSDDKLWIQKRMRDERKFQRDRHEAAVAGGRKSQQIRAGTPATLKLASSYPITPASASAFTDRVKGFARSAQEQVNGHPSAIEGRRGVDAAGKPIVFWRGAWTPEAEAALFGWTPEETP